MTRTRPKVEPPAQKRSWWKLILGIAVVLIFLGGLTWLFFNFYPPAPESYLPLKENWAALENRAHNWKNDAYLYSVQYKKPSDIQLVAKYLSPSLPDDELLITINQSGDINLIPLNLGFKAPVSKPIQLSDFKFDGQQAMALFAQDQSIGNCIKLPKKQLTMDIGFIGVPTWTLIIFDCPSPGKQKTAYLNAQTGIKIGVTISQ